MQKQQNVPRAREKTVDTCREEGAVPVYKLWRTSLNIGVDATYVQDKKQYDLKGAPEER